MTPNELKAMRNPLSVKNVRRIRKLLKAIDYNITMRNHTIFELQEWSGEVRDELVDCIAILNEWNDRKKEVKNG